MNIVPAGEKLEAQLFGPSRAIGFIRAGQRVLLRYEAFPYQKFGQYEGVVAEVSRTAINPAELTQLSGLTSLLAADEPVYRMHRHPRPPDGDRLWRGGAAAARDAAGSGRPDGEAAADRMDVRAADLAYRKMVGMNVLEHVNLGFGRRLPMILQTEAADSAACLSPWSPATSATTPTLTHLRRQYGLSLRGATLKDLIRIADGLGMVSRPLRIDSTRSRCSSAPASCTGTSTTSSWSRASPPGPSSFTIPPWAFAACPARWSPGTSPASPWN